MRKFIIFYKTNNPLITYTIEVDSHTMYEAEKWIKRIIHNVKIDTIKEIF